MASLMDKLRVRSETKFDQLVGELRKTHREWRTAEDDSLSAKALIETVLRRANCTMGRIQELRLQLANCGACRQMIGVVHMWMERPKPGLCPERTMPGRNNSEVMSELSYIGATAAELYAVGVIGAVESLPKEHFGTVTDLAKHDQRLDQLKARFEELKAEVPLAWSTEDVDIEYPTGEAEREQRLVRLRFRRYPEVCVNPDLVDSLLAV